MDERRGTDAERAEEESRKSSARLDTILRQEAAAGEARARPRARAGGRGRAAAARASGRAGARATSAARSRLAPGAT